jgi:predicted metal-binding protein
MATPDCHGTTGQGCLMVAEDAITVFVCVTCGEADPDARRPGRLLFDAIAADLHGRANHQVRVTPVACLSVCKRPCTVALAAPGRWTYVVGDLGHRDHVDDIITAALRYGAAKDGIVPWRERPQSFRKGVVSRIPPLGFRPE